MIRQRHRLLLVWLAYLAFVSLGLPDGLLGVAWPSIREYFALRLDAIGPLLLMFTMGYLLSSFSSGRLLSHMTVGHLVSGVVVAVMPVRRLLRCCIAGIALGAGLIWLDATSLISSLGLALMGVSSAAFSAAC